VAIGEAEAGVGQSLAQCQFPQHARLADAGVAGEDGGGAGLHHVAQLVDDGLRWRHLRE
jgi:hypothetical protein